jgi:hypothetical protein
MNTASETAFTSPSLIKPRNPRVARQLAWCCPGLGHMYCGSLVRGLWIMGASQLPLCVGIVALCKDTRYWPIVLAGFALGVVISFWSVWDAIQLARRTRPDYRLKDYNRLSAYLLIYVVPTWSLAAGVAITLLAQVGNGMRTVNAYPALGLGDGDQMFVSKMAIQEPLTKNDRIVFRFSPTARPITPGLVLAVAGETITTDTGTTVVPPDQVWLRYQDNAGKVDDRFVSSYAIGGKIIFRYWPLSRFGKIPTGTTN